NGPACVETCPTNALKLIDRNAMQDMINEKRRRAALDTTIDFMF
ncbi:MAG: electron transport protein HydN, partial [Enterobacterales bacterium]|nr:electron transport protein HydN [Enterobacterales bacterium]